MSINIAESQQTIRETSVNKTGKAVSDARIKITSNRSRETTIKNPLN